MQENNTELNPPEEASPSEQEPEANLEHIQNSEPTNILLAAAKKTIEQLDNLNNNL